MKQRTLIDMINEPRVMARIVVAATAAATRALAEGRAIAVMQDGRYFLQYPDGERIEIKPSTQGIEDAE